MGAPRGGEGRGGALKEQGLRRRGQPWGRPQGIGCEGGQTWGMRRDGCSGTPPHCPMPHVVTPHALRDASSLPECQRRSSVSLSIISRTCSRGAGAWGTQGTAQGSPVEAPPMRAEGAAMRAEGEAMRAEAPLSLASSGLTPLALCPMRPLVFLLHSLPCSLLAPSRVPPCPASPVGCLIEVCHVLPVDHALRWIRRQ